MPFRHGLILRLYFLTDLKTAFSAVFLYIFLSICFSVERGAPKKILSAECCGNCIFLAIDKTGGGCYNEKNINGKSG